ncbi:hypothetical protein [Melghirimyces algeriensis]|uniref:Uncharacterized protein n=1 Tax=Melghirimyces algeriensis TaxID=910412 RepID=A0A521CP01_9BACL|nr:hypothetical protein [Melghirimyces algeriensis]SMO61179.1 hypothetical protein SAMN06264849_10497 [Melghirimyces algeriensis]
MRYKLYDFFITWGLFMCFFIGSFVWERIAVDPISETWGDVFVYCLAAAFYSGIALSLFGIPVSILSDKITKKLPIRPFWAFLIHTGLAFGGVILLTYGNHGSTMLSSLSAILGTIFWLVDELIKWKIGYARK